MQNALVSQQNIEPLLKVNEQRHSLINRHIIRLCVGMVFFGLLCVGVGLSIGYLTYWIVNDSGMSEYEYIPAQLLRSFQVLLPGSIVPWIPHERRDPPKKWVICDGRLIETGPWKGSKTPNLTGHFLIGSVLSEVIVPPPPPDSQADFDKNNPPAQVIMMVMIIMMMIITMKMIMMMMVIIIPPHRRSRCSFSRRVVTAKLMATA